MVLSRALLASVGLVLGCSGAPSSEEPGSPQELRRLENILPLGRSCVQPAGSYRITETREAGSCSDGVELSVDISSCDSASCAYLHPDARAAGVVEKAGCTGRVELSDDGCSYAYAYTCARAAGIVSRYEGTLQWTEDGDSAEGTARYSLTHRDDESGSETLEAESACESSYRVRFVR